MSLMTFVVTGWCTEIGLTIWFISFLFTGDVGVDCLGLLK